MVVRRQDVGVFTGEHVCVGMNWRNGGSLESKSLTGEVVRLRCWVDYLPGE